MSNLPRPTAILYDWDNTLVDTWPVIHSAMNVLFRYMDMPEWTLLETKSNVRQSMRDAFPRMFGDRWEEARDVFYQAFEAVHLNALVSLDGMRELLDGVKAAEIPQAVVSNKQGRYLRKEAEHLGIDGIFHSLIGAGDAARDKPAPDPVHAALEGTGIALGPHVLFVGDSGIDMQTAHAAGLTPILIGMPEGDEKALSDFPPAGRFDNLQALHKFVTCHA
ncbi:MAG: HAD-IA family hydrolase [Alphaproteobacteria bacterium]